MITIPRDERISSASIKCPHSSIIIHESRIFDLGHLGRAMAGRLASQGVDLIL